MKNLNYKINRDRIYLGEVARIYDYAEYLVDGEKHSYIDGSCFYRYMLFVLTDDGYANDLLYESTNYPVLGIADHEVFLNDNHAKAIIKYAKLDNLLKDNGYPKKLEYKDIMKILLDFCYSDFYTCEQSHEGNFTTSDTLYRNNYPAYYENNNIKLGSFNSSTLRRDVKRRFKSKNCNYIKEANYKLGSKDLSELLFDINKYNNQEFFSPFKPAYSEEGIVLALKH